MANELQLTLRVGHTKEPKDPWAWSGVIQATQTGKGVYANTVSAATTGTDLSFGGITPGLVMLVNLDDTNFVNWGMSDGGTLKAPGILYPTTRWPAMFFAKPGETIRLQADTAACEVYFKAWEL